MHVRITRLRPDVSLPEYKTSGACCFDIACVEDVVIQPREIVDLPTGLVFGIPEGYMLLVAARSSTPPKGVQMPHGVGIIDQDFCGPEDELKIRLVNFTEKPVALKKGDRVCQAGFVRIDRAVWDEGPAMSKKTRGGFGTTG